MWIMMDKDRSSSWKVRSFFKIEQGKHVRNRKSLKGKSRLFDWQQLLPCVHYVQKLIFISTSLIEISEIFTTLVCFKKTCRILFILIMLCNTERLKIGSYILNLFLICFLFYFLSFWVQIQSIIGSIAFLACEV